MTAVLSPGRRWPRLRLVAVVACAVVAFVLVGGVPPAWAETVREAQWHLDFLRIEEVHEVSRGDGVVVAVVDSAVDASHPDLAGQVLAGTGTATGSSPNGQSSYPEDDHGTAMAGVIAARGGGPMAALGIAPGVKILPVDVGMEYRREETIGAGIRWAVDNGAKVINVSIAGDAARGLPPPEVEAVSYAVAHDVVVVAGAGNVDVTGAAVGSPASIPGVVAVSGVDRGGVFWSNSSSGPKVVIAAPAVDIASTGPRAIHSSGYVKGSGTSNATAIVSGVAALIRAKYPSLNAASVINRLIATARNPNGGSGRDSQYGYGVVQPMAALTAEVPEVAENPLGAPSVGPSGTAADQVAGDSDDEKSLLELLAIPAACVVFVILVVVVVVVIATRSSKRSRRRVSAAAPSYGRQPPPYPGGHPFPPNPSQHPPHMFQHPPPSPHIPQHPPSPPHHPSSPPQQLPPTSQHSPSGGLPPTTGLNRPPPQ